MSGTSKSTRGSATKAGLPQSSAKVRAHRARLKKRGLRPIQFWVPDVTSAAFRAEARRQSRAVATSPSAADDQAFIDAVST